MDINDYIDAGLIGCKQKSKEEIFTDWQVWNDQLSTANQTQSSFLKNVNTWYRTSALSEIPSPCQTSWDESYYVGFWDLVLEHKKMSNIFWNSLSGLTGDGTQYTGMTNGTFCRPSPYQASNVTWSGCTGYTTDYTNKLTINKTIHDDHVSATVNLMKYLKDLMYVIDGDTFVDFNPSTAKLNGYDDNYRYNITTP